MAWFNLILAAIFLVISFLLAPKPAKQKPREFEDPETPTADASRPIPWLFGTMTITGLNTVALASKRYERDKVKA